MGSSLEINRLIYGKNDIQKIVSCAINDDVCELFIQQPDGSVKSEFKPNKFWLAAHKTLDSGFKPLNGNQFYKYVKLYSNRDQFLDDRSRYYRNSTFSIYNEIESAQVMYGFTFFKGLKPEEITTLSFDIETTTLKHTEEAKVLLIANTLEKNGVRTRKMFCYDDYPSQREMIEDWCAWVREVDPSVLTPFNGVGFDLPYIEFCCEREGGHLSLGRDGSVMKIDPKESHFRKDGSQSYAYHKIKIYGREIVDTFFLALKYDSATKKYENYKLKNIVKQENLEVTNRQFYDAETIRDNYRDLEEWRKIKEYAKYDADDALNLYWLMIPSFFYFTRSIPKSFQAVIESATGSQLNAMMIRS